ncbi:hypothetical protein F5Y16DRAFT_370385 [Xylariaceae sp. FL0255]|nr:hypothetical protein F5Y16DRAFT_370385 [Xylariaceae sp. FL0255]
MASEKLTLEEWLDDLCVRFLINLPRSDLSSVPRICFQIEEAQWFYEDFIRPLDPSLPSMTLRNFSLRMFKHCPLLAQFSEDAHLKAFEQFMQYKTRVPVRGAIMLNEAMDAALLVRGWKKGSSWSFPRGKINKDEDDLECAIREVYEETGFHLRQAGLVDRNAPVQYVEVTMHDQQVKLYVFRGIREDTVFETRTRKEIGAISWFKVSDLPAFRKKKVAGKQDNPSPDKFYMVAPFMVALRKWVMRQKELDAQNAPALDGHHHPTAFYEENITDENIIDQTPRLAAPVTNAEIIESATRELKHLLQIKVPPTQGLQLPSSSAPSSQQANNSLMSFLQPKSVNPEGASLHTPREQQQQSTPQQPMSPHHHQPTQRMPVSEYATPPSFPIEPQSNISNNHYQQHSNQHRSRPQVLVPSEVQQHTHQLPPQHQLPNAPVQLLHPQPLPPQVQKAMLLRDMASPPNTRDTTNMPGPPNMPPTYQSMGQGLPQQTQPNPGYQAPGKAPPQLPAHSANLLNVLKGSNMPTSAQPPPSYPSPSHRYPQTEVESHHHGQRAPAFQTDSPNRYNTTNLPPATLPSATMNAPAPFSATLVQRPLPPTDKHRAGLLDMFKRGPSAVSQHPSEVQGLSSPSGVPPAHKIGSPRQQWENQGMSNADVFKATARENGKPIQMNPETNLPYGAHSILSRRHPSQGSARSPALSTRTSHELPAHVPGRSPETFRNQKSPYYNQMAVATQAPPKQQMTPHGHMNSPTSSYPYVGGGQANVPPNVLSQSTQGGSGFMGSGLMKPRQNSTVEHRNNLLSILGKPPGSVEQQGKGPEAQGSEQAVPRSRLASFASNDSGRGSAAPISTADRNFLLGFLENASHNSRGRIN